MSRLGKRAGTEPQIPVILPTERDDRLLQGLSHRSHFVRTLGSCTAICYQVAFCGIPSVVTGTFNVPMLLGGPVSVVWTWAVGSVMALATATSVAEMVSAFPTSGGLYTASGYLVPVAYRPIVAWTGGYLVLIGFITGLAATTFNITRIVIAIATITQDRAFKPSSGQFVLMSLAVLLAQGLLCSVNTKWLGRTVLWSGMAGLVFTLVLPIILLGKGDLQPPSFVFAKLDNQSGGPDALAVLLGLLSVQYSMTGYDGVAHCSEEFVNAALVVPRAIVVSCFISGALGWYFSITFVAASPSDLRALADSDLKLAILQILFDRLGRTGSLVATSCILVLTFNSCLALTAATGRLAFAMSRDKALPYSSFFERMSVLTKTPLIAIWSCIVIAALVSLLDIASETAAQAIFSMSTVAIDLSYLLPVVCKLFNVHIFRTVPWTPGPFNLGPRLGPALNAVASLWITFTCVILVLPQRYPPAPERMNYASVVTGSTLLLSFVYYGLGARKRYRGPLNDSW